jgi:FAD/FMN-containing dehydrogenase
MNLNRRQSLALIAATPWAATAQPLPLPPKLGDGEVEYTFGADPGSGRFDTSYNRRTQLKPAIRAHCKTPKAVANIVQWTRARDVPFAVRSGGHSFEGFSQSSSVVIDTRMLNHVRIDPASQTVTVGAGATIGQVYREAAKASLAFSAGSCPTVGVAGHALGGGYGMLSRALGLVSDNMISATMVMADGSIVTADAMREPDLFWASRGGGGGTLGIATEFRFRLHRVQSVCAYSVAWELAPDQATNLIDLWQSWSLSAPDGMTTLVRIAKSRGGQLRITFSGAALSPAADTEKAVLGTFAAFAPFNVRREFADKTFLGLIDRFSGGWSYESKYSKGKSDFTTVPLAREAIATLARELMRRPPNAVIVMLDLYGGAIARIGAQETAFVHRERNALCIQYYTSWQRAADTAHYVQEIDRLYAALRLYMPGKAYVNYCDLGLKDWQRAYWGDNAKRLAAVKRKYDPQDVFRHAQSIKPA